MYIAPPIVPGIPDANSKPLSPKLATLYESFIKLYPAPTVTKLSSIFKLLNSSNLIKIPSYYFVNIKLEPFPIILYFISLSFRNFNNLISFFLKFVSCILF